MTKPKSNLARLPDSGLRHLRPATRAWVERVRADWALDEHHDRLLQLAAEAWDRAQEARRALDVLGLTYDDRFGAPPLVLAEPATGNLG